MGFYGKEMPAYVNIVIYIPKQIPMGGKERWLKNK
jgi:hypothetical protein